MDLLTFARALVAGLAVTLLFTLSMAAIVEFVTRFAASRLGQHQGVDLRNHTDAL